MNLWRGYRKLSDRQRRTLRHAVWLVGLARLLLWGSSLKVARAFLPRSARWFKPLPPSQDLETEVWAVNVAAHFIPRSTCLVKALALHTLLSRYGQETLLQIGVARGSEDQFLAHAWVEQEGRVLIGGEESNLYTTLLSMN